MPNYTTGEIAKQAQVSIRTVQYYDRKGLLKPAAISEGGKRQYTDRELERLKLIRLLKSLGLSLNDIRSLLASPDTTNVLNSLLTEQAATLTQQKQEIEQQLRTIHQVQRSITDLRLVSSNNLIGIEKIMESQKHLRKLHATMLLLGLLMDAIEIATLVFWLMTGIWYPVLIGFGFVIIMAAWLLNHYYQQVRYVCPHCHTTFQPSWRQFSFSKHNAKMRKLTCPHCGYRGYCVEISQVS